MSVGVKSALAGSRREKSWRKISRIEYSPQKAVLVDRMAIWKLAVCRKVPVIWFIWTHRPLTVCFLRFAIAEVPIRRLVKAGIMIDFTGTFTVGQFAAAPIVMPGNRARCWVLPHYSQKPRLLCRATGLEGGELAAAQQLGNESKISFLCPPWQGEAPGGLHSNWSARH